MYMALSLKQVNQGNSLEVTFMTPVSDKRQYSVKAKEKVNLEEKKKIYFING